MAIPLSIRRFVEGHGVSYAPIHHRAAFTAQEEAAASHVPGRDWAKTVVCMADGFPVLALVPAHFHVDLDALRVASGARYVRLATEHEFATLYPECETGAMAPFGPLYNQPVYIDEALAIDPGHRVPRRHARGRDADDAVGLRQPGASHRRPHRQADHALGQAHGLPSRAPGPERADQSGESRGGLRPRRSRGFRRSLRLDTPVNPACRDTSCARCGDPHPHASHSLAAGFTVNQRARGARSRSARNPQDHRGPSRLAACPLNAAPGALSEQTNQASRRGGLRAPGGFAG